MDKPKFIDQEQGKLMKSFFSLQEALESIRQMSPNILASLSVKDLYDIIIQ